MRRAAGTARDLGPAAQGPTVSQTLESTLRQSAWAPTLSEVEMRQLLREAYERRLSVGGHAVRHGDPADFWYGVIEGLVKVSVSHADGRVSTITGVAPGGWGGEGTLISRSHWRYDGVAIRDTRVACIPRHSFERLLSTNLGFNRFLLNQLNARLSLVIGVLEQDRLHGPDARVARCIASLFDPELMPAAGDFVQLSQEEIGLLAGVSRQRTNEALRELERAGLLRTEYGGVTVLGLPALRAYQGRPDGRPPPMHHGPRSRLS